MELNVKFNLPDPWLARHYDEYHRGRTQYKVRTANGSGAPDGGSFIMGQYHGALALIKAGFVKIEGPQEFLDLVNAPDSANTPMWVIGVITTYIADALEASASGPLPDWMKKSSDTSSTQTDTPPPEG